MDQIQDVGMKDYAINTAISMIARSLAMIEWRVKTPKGYTKNKIYHKLNIKPNVNQSATVFWESFVRKLFYEDGEVLVLLIDDQMVLADSFDHKEFAVKPDYFENVTVKTHTFSEKPFYMENTLFIQQEFRKLKRLIRHLDESYGELFGRIIQVGMRTNQVRATAKITGRLAADPNGKEYLENYIKKLYKAFESSSVAIAPEQDGLEYKEHSRDTTNRSAVNDAIATGDAYLDKVLIACGIHPSLVYGDMADTEWHQQQYLLNVVNPLAKLIENELNAKMFTQKQYEEGYRIEYSNIRTEHTNIFDVAAATEKLVGSNTFTPNEIREATGYEGSNAVGMDEFYITKNIEKHNDKVLEEG